MARLKPPLPSPNLADSLMMTMPIPINNPAAQGREVARAPGIVRRTRDWRLM
jgi:hypothetical protein